MNTQALTQETMMNRIVKHTVYDLDYLRFDSGICICWVPGAEEWLLLDADSHGRQAYQFGSLDELVALVSDEDITKYYEEYIADYYDEDEVDE